MKCYTTSNISGILTIFPFSIAPEKKQGMVTSIFLTFAIWMAFLDKLSMLYPRALLTSILLLCTPMCFAQSGTVSSSSSTISGGDLIYASRVSKVLKSAKRTKNTLIFSIKGHHVIGLLHERYQKLQLIYIFPTDPDAADCKVQLEQAAKQVHDFFLPDQTPALIHIHEDGLFAQIKVEDAPTVTSDVYDSSTTNLALKILRSVGNPQTWRDNRLIWQIPFNSNRSCLELALDLSQSSIKELDFNLRGTNASTKAVLDLINGITGLRFRVKQTASEAREWRSYTGFSTSQILGAASKSGFSNQVNVSSIFLVRKGNYLKLGSSAILQRSNRDESTWIQSSSPSYPSLAENMTPAKPKSSTPLETKSSTVKFRDEDIDDFSGTSTKSSPSTKTSSPISGKKMSPGIALENYIKQLNAK